MALLSAAKSIKEHIAICGAVGCDYVEVLNAHNVSPTVGLAIAKKFLQPSGFVFYSKEYQVLVDANDQCLREMNWICFAPEASARWAYGFESSEQYANYTEKVANNNITRISVPVILGNLGVSGAAGMTYQELDPYNIAPPKAIGMYVDRLLACGLVTKSMVMPTGNECTRCSTQTTVVHLKRFARYFQPAVHHLQLLPGEHVRDEIFRFFRRLLDAHDLQYLPCMDLSRQLGLNKRHLQLLRLQAQNASRNHPEAAIVRFFEAIAAPTLASGVGYGGFRWMWVMGRGPGKSDPRFDPIPQPVDPAHRSRNLSLYELLDWAIAAAEPRGGMSAQELRRLTGLSNKRAAKMAEDLRKNMGYRTQREQKGKNMVFRLLPRPAAGDETSSKAIATGKSKAIKTEPSKKRKRRRATDSEEDEEGDDDEAIEDNEDSNIFKEAENLEEEGRGGEPEYSHPKAPQILHYLRSHSPHFTGSIMEATSILRGQAKAAGIGLVDKKTVQRCVMSLEVVGAIRAISMLRSEETIHVFGGSHGEHITLLLLVGQGEELSDEERIHMYFDEYRGQREEQRYATEQRQKEREKEKQKETKKMKATILESSAAVSNFAETDREQVVRKRVRNKKAKEKHDGEDQEEGREEEPQPKRAKAHQQQQQVILPAVDESQLLQMNLGRRITTSQPADAPAARIFKAKAETEEEEEEEEEVDHQQQQHIRLKPTKKLQQGRGDGDEIWSDDQDLALLEAFFVSFLIQSARKGLPHVLKPPTMLAAKTTTPSKHHQRVRKQFFELPAWNSVCLDIDFGAVEVNELRQLYTSTSGIAVDGMTLSACRCRLLILLRRCKTLRQLVVLLLWGRKKRMSLLAKQLAAFVLREGQSHWLYDTDQRLVQQRQIILGHLMRHFELGVYPTFTIQDLMSISLSAPSSPLEVTDCRDQVITIVRELYLHNILRREGTDDEPGFTPELTRFRLAPAYAGSQLDRPFGSFFFDLLGRGGGDDFSLRQLPRDELIEENPSPQDYREARALLTVAMAVESLSPASLGTTEQTLAAATIAAVRMMIVDDHATIQRPVDEIITQRQQLVAQHHLHPQDEGMPAGYELFKSHPCKEAVEKRRTFDRLEVQLSMDTTTARTISRKFLALSQSKIDTEDEQVPWIDTKTGEVLPNVLRLFAVQVLSYLAEHPGSTLKQLHALVFILSYRAVTVLMQQMVAFELVKSSQSPVRAVLPNAFVALDFWRGGGRGLGQGTEVVYELAT